MKGKFLKAALAIILILVMTMANFLLLGVNAISYAAELIHMDQNTSHKNVEFMAYFKDAQGQKVTNLTQDIAAKDLKLYLQLQVKKEGYLNGQISLRNSNFKLKTDLLSEGITKIENNIVTFQSIKAGEIKEFEIGIELLKEDSFDLNWIRQESQILMEGIYRDSTQKDIAVTGNRNVTLQYKSSYTAQNAKAILSEDIITNKIVSVQGENKRVIQVKVTSGILDNAFPIKESKIEMLVPTLKGRTPREVLVNSVDLLGTNGKTMTQENWNYDATSGKLTVMITNQAVDHKVVWNKTQKDTLIVTYMFDEELEIQEQDLVASSQIILYDSENTILTANQNVTLTAESRDSIYSMQIQNQGASIAKGNLYEGIEKEFSQKTVIYFNLANVADQVTISENGSRYIGEKYEKQAPIFYRQSQLSLQNLKEILGEEGTISIFNLDNQQVICQLSLKDIKEEEILVSYPNDVRKIMIQTSKPEKIGKIEINTTKVIGASSREEIKRVEEITQNLTGSYQVGDTKYVMTEQIGKISLQETQTNASMELNKTELSTMVDNNLEMKVILHTNSETQELYKNPVIQIELPEKIESIHVNSVKLLYEEELKIKSAILKGHKIIIELEGEQTQYKDLAIDGATLLIQVGLTFDKKETSSTEQIKLSYTNEKAIHYTNSTKVGEDIKQIKVVSYAGLITTNAIPEYQVEAVNEEGTKEVAVLVGADSKQATVEGEIINNHPTAVSDVKVLGTFPTRNAVSDSNNMDVTVASGIKVNGMKQDEVKVYYSENANATTDLQDVNNGWKDTITDAKAVKKYLVAIHQLEASQEANFSYQTTIPENLEYNNEAKQNYEVSYRDETQVQQNVKASTLSLTTGSGPVVETNLRSTVGGKETKEAKVGEIIRYEMTVTNTGSEEVSNVKLTGKVPEGTILLERNQEDFYKGFEGEYESVRFTQKENQQVEFTLPKIAPGETATKWYEVKVKSGIEKETSISNQIDFSYNDIQKQSNLITNTLKTGDLTLTLISIPYDNQFNAMTNSGIYTQTMEIKNHSNQDKTNLVIEFASNDDSLEPKSIEYVMQDQEKAKIEKNTNKIIIDQLKANSSIVVGLQILVKPLTGVQEKIVTTVVKATDGNITYYSNEENDRVTGTADNIVMTNTSSTAGKYLKVNDVVEYVMQINNLTESEQKGLKIEDAISQYITIDSIEREGKKLVDQDYSITTVDGQKNIIIPIDLAAKSNTTIKIKGMINHQESKTIEIKNKACLLKSGVVLKETEEVKHMIEAYQDNQPIDPEDPDNPVNPDNPDDSTSKTRTISGVAWLDENEDGIKDSNEKLLSGIIVKLLNTQTNEIVKDKNGSEITEKTNQNGFYSLESIPQGEYLVIFEYDTVQYQLTTFKKEGVSETKNSNVINREITMNGENKKVATTESITISNMNIANMNIGLRKAKNFDLQLEKYISKVIVQNGEGTKTYEYDNTTTAKAEINAKLVNSTNVIVEYKIKVTNVGEVEGYVKKVVDNLSSDYKFSSELNKDWYQSGNKLYNKSLANEKIKPGESQELTLTVTKKMTENNIGLINNTAEITEDYNELGIQDRNSTPGNNLASENDMGSADLIISIKTGQVVMTIGLILSTVIIIGAGSYIIAKVILRKKII